MLSFIEKIMRAVETAVVCAGLGAMAAVIFAQGVLGDVLHIKMFEWAWGLEFAKYAMVWVMGAGASAAVAQRRHMAVDAILIALPKGARRLLLTCVWLVSCALCGAAVPAALSFVAQTRQYGMRAEALGIPVWWAHLALPFAAAMLCARFGLAAASEAAGLPGEAPFGAGGGEADR